MKYKKGVGWQYILGLIIALMVFGIILFIIFRGKGVALGWADWIGNLI